MKRALGYVRISTKDQSNFSLDGQEDYIKRHCEKEQWELIAIAKDEGESAKSFDRANWKELEAYIKKNYRDIDYLVVAKYDRFSRDVSEALAKMGEFETKYKIKVISVMEPISLPPESPYFFQIRATLLINGQVELMVIRDRTKFGLHNGSKSGRYLHAAPFGYKNSRDDRNKPIILVDERKAQVIQEIYNLFLSDVPLAEIGRIVRRRGFSNKGNSALPRILANPVYAGFIVVPAYHDEPEQLAKGIHDPIISESVWYRTQAKLNAKPQARIIFNEEVPLRNVVKCHCGRCLTAGKSKGKLRHYWYYKCHSHPKVNLNADKLHSQVEAIIKELSFTDEHIQEIDNMLRRMVSGNLENREAQVKAHQKELREVEVNLESLEGKYIKNEVDSDTYKKWRTRLQNDRYRLLNELAELSTPIKTIWQKYSEEILALKDLNYIYQAASIQKKQAFIRLVFNNQLYYQNGTCRTPYLLPLFASKAASLQQKRLLVIEQPLRISGETPMCSEDGS